MRRVCCIPGFISYRPLQIHFNHLRVFFWVASVGLRYMIALETIDISQSNIKRLSDYAPRKDNPMPRPTKFPPRSPLEIRYHWHRNCTSIFFLKNVGKISRQQIIRESCVKCVLSRKYSRFYRLPRQKFVRVSFHKAMLLAHDKETA